MSVDVSVWRADIERQMAEWQVCLKCLDERVKFEDHGWAPEAIARMVTCDCVNGRIPSPVYIVGEGRVGTWKWITNDRGEYANLPPVGWPSPNETTPCENCDGEGQHEWDQSDDCQMASNGYEDANCEACGGSGVTAGTRTELTVMCDTCSQPDATPDVPGEWCCDNGSVLWATATWQTLPGDTPGTFKAELTGIELA